ncbi:MAG: hypothetical protein HQK58_10515 [Deltaproteobacteria bacterium]|nr:hypothetical protein [Deltaproteobacteria bacterium]
MLRQNQIFSTHHRFLTTCAIILIWVSVSVGALNGANALAADGQVKAEPLFTSVIDQGRSQEKLGREVMRVRPVKLNAEVLFPTKTSKKAGRQAGKDILLNLFDDVVLTAVIDGVPSGRDNQSQVKEVTGRIKDVADSSVILVVVDGVMSGNITMPGAFYQIRYLGGGIHAVYQIDQSAFPPELPPQPVSPSLEKRDGPRDGKATDDGSQIDIMVVYTPAARMAAGGVTAMKSMINLAVTETNTGYGQSGVSQRVRLVHTAEVAYDETGFDWYTTLTSLTVPTTPAMTEVHSLRDAYAADIVVMLVKDAGFCGLSWLMTVPETSFSSNAFSVVSSSCATGYYSFAHEMGHIMGSEHDRAHATNVPAYPYSFGYQDPTQLFRDIMSYDCPNKCPRINYWSNPDVLYQGRPTGVDYQSISAADNRRSLNNTAITVANFRTGLIRPDGVWKTNTGRSLYLQTYDNGGALLISTVDGVNLIAAYDGKLENSIFDGVDVYGGKEYRLVLTVTSNKAATFTTYRLTSGTAADAGVTETCTKFADADPVRKTDGVWKDAALTQIFYAQTYTTGGLTMIKTSDGRTATAFFDAGLDNDTFDGSDIGVPPSRRLVYQFISDQSAAATLYDLNQKTLGSWSCTHDSFPKTVSGS